MRILLISCVFPPEPIVSSTLSKDIALGLRDKGHKVTVVHPKPTRPNGFKFGETPVYEGIEQVTTDSFVCPQSSLRGRYKENISFGKECAKFIDKHSDDFDVIYFNAWPLFSQKAIAKKAVEYKIPYIAHIQDIYPDSLSNKLPGIFGKLLYRLLLPIDKIILTKAKAVLVISENMKNILAETRNIDKSKFTVAQNWQEETPFIEYQDQNKSAVHEKFTFMYLGNNGPIAGVDFLIDCFGKADIMGARLVVAGSGSMTEKCKEQAKQYDEKQIEFLHVLNGMVPETQAIADVMLLPVKKGAAMSSIPSKLPAYMFSAKPIIGSLDKESDTAKAINDSGCGWVIGPENEQMMITTMKDVARIDVSVLKQKGAMGFEYAMKHFSKGENLKKIITLIENMGK